MSKSITIVDIIKASTSVDPVSVQSKMGYSFSPTAADLTDDEFITKSIGAEMAVRGTAPVKIDKSTNSLLAAGQPVMFFVDISLYPQFDDTSEIITQSPDSTGKPEYWYDMPVIVQDTNNDGTGIFTGWNVIGHTVDGTTLSEDLIIIISGGSSGGTTPTGAAGGDLSGAYPDPIVNTINGYPASYYDLASSVQTQLNGKQPLGNYAKIDGTNTLRTAADFGETASVPDVGHIDDPGAGDNTYAVQCWLHIASQTGSMAVQMELMFTMFGTTWTKTFYPQGSSTGPQSVIDFYPYPSMNVRVTSGTTVQVLAIVSGSGTILYECGCTIELKK